MGKFLKYFVFLVVMHAQCVQSNNDDSDDYIKRPGVVDFINTSKNKYSHPMTTDDRGCTTNGMTEADILALKELTKAYTANAHIVPKIHVVNYNPQVVKATLDVDWADVGRKLSINFANQLSSKNIGKDFAKGFVDQFSDPNIIYQLKRITANFGTALEKTAGKDSELFNSVDNVSNDYKKLINDFADAAIHRNLNQGMAELLAGSAIFLALLYGVPMGMKMLERQLTRPKLIIESSKKSVMENFTSMFYDPKKVAPVEMVFSPELKQHLDTIVQVTSSIHAKIKEGKTNVKYRNLMLYGPPGTGKTMFAKDLAKRSGLEYVFMSGSSFSKFKDGEGIEALDELFAWANNSTGLMIFIDESETFLLKREGMDPQSRSYQLLNNFLNYTGERSNKFMIVFATNHKDQLDSAMYRRIDDLIEMPLPCKKQRIDTLNLYKKKILMDVEQNGDAFVNSVVKCLTALKIEEIAVKTKGFSYGDLEGIINTIKTDADILARPMVSDALVATVVERAVKKYSTFNDNQQLALVLN